MHLINEGGPMFMIPLILLLITSLFLIAKGFKNNNNKNLELIKAISLFAMVFGFFGFILGLIQLLDVIPDASSISPKVLAVGFKCMVLPPTLGTFTFLVGRLGIIILIWLKKE